MATISPNPYFSSWHNVSRDINLVMLKNGDVVAFINEVFPVDTAFPGLQTFGYQNGPQKWNEKVGDIYGSYAGVSSRSLVYYRMSGNAVVQGPRPVYYAISPIAIPMNSIEFQQGPQAISNLGLAMFTDVFNPKIIYDADANVLHLWFWSNWNATNPFIGLCPKYYFSQTLNRGLAAMGPDASTGSSEAARVLYYVTGKFEQVWARGGYMYGYQNSLNPSGGTPVGNQGFQNEGWDLIPIFTSGYAIAATYTAGSNVWPIRSGTVSDGYSYIGTQWPSYFPIQFVSPITPNCPFYNVTAYPLGPTGLSTTALGEPLNLNLYADSTTSTGTFATGMQTALRILGDGI